MSATRMAHFAAAAAGAALGFVTCSANADPATTTFSYQGQLEADGMAANGQFDLLLEIYSAAIGGSLLQMTVIDDVPVNEGVFTLDLTAASNVFTGERQWLQISVRPGDSGGAFTPLSPRQEVLPAPAAQGLSGGLDTAYDDHPSIVIDSGPVSVVGPAMGESLQVCSDGGAATIRLIADRGGFGGTMDLYDEMGVAHSRFEADVDGEGGFLQVRRTNADQGFIIDGNALGTMEPAMLLTGSSRLLSFDFTAASNDDATMLLPSSVNAIELLAEPGVASRATQDNSQIAAGSTVNLASRTITVPTAGFVFAIATTQGQFLHSMGTSSVYNFGVSDVSQSLPANQDVGIRIDNDLPSALYVQPVTVQGLFSVGAGSQTFYFVGEANAAAGSVIDTQFTLVFFPTSYGTVESTIAELQGPALTDANAVSPTALSDAGRLAERRTSIAVNESRLAAEFAAMRTDMERRLAELEAAAARQRGAAAPRDASLQAPADEGSSTP